MTLFTKFLLSATLVAAVTSSSARAETVDEKIKKAEASDLIKIVTQDHTRDACDRGNNITITSTTDGDVVLKPGETKYFMIDKDKGDYERSGGWKWNCGATPERARIKGATYIKAVAQ